MANATEAQAPRAALIQDKKARLAELNEVVERHNAGTSIVSHGWVVTMPMMGAMEFDLEKITEGKEKGRYRAVSVKPAGKVESAARYTREDAHTLAADLKNGAGEAGTAKFWEDLHRRWTFGAGSLGIAFPLGDICAVALIDAVKDEIASIERILATLEAVAKSEA